MAKWLGRLIYKVFKSAIVEYQKELVKEYEKQQPINYRVYTGNIPAGHFIQSTSTTVH